MRPARQLDEFPELHSRNLLERCGCGMPEAILEFVCKVLELLEKRYDRAAGPDAYETCLEGLKAIGLDLYTPIGEFTLHTLDHLGFLEHGGSIGGSWLTNKGKQLVKAYDKLGKDRLQEALDDMEVEILNPEVVTE